jgi:hypothetical protein
MTPRPPLTPTHSLNSPPHPHQPTNQPTTTQEEEQEARPARLLALCLPFPLAIPAVSQRGGGPRRLGTICTEIVRVLRLRLAFWGGRGLRHVCCVVWCGSSSSNNNREVVHIDVWLAPLRWRVWLALGGARGRGASRSFRIDPFPMVGRILPRHKAAPQKRRKRIDNITEAIRVFVYRAELPLGAMSLQGESASQTFLVTCAAPIDQEGASSGGQMDWWITRQGMLSAHAGGPPNRRR